MGIPRFGQRQHQGGIVLLPVLDPGMIMAASGNALTQDIPRAAFVADEFWQVLEPMLSIEELNAAPPSTQVQGLAKLSP
jgi:hypothetical protein